MAGIIISDHEYPALVAHQLLSKILDEFLSRYPKSAFQNSNQELPFPQLKEYIVKYQDPHAADSIMKVRARYIQAMLETKSGLTSRADPKGAR